uniref:Uncharacterized protein n=1 Tax=Strongyloides papillosus TaxID=174720 RepID=A0A0N5C652_STREA
MTVVSKFVLTFVFIVVEDVPFKNVDFTVDVSEGSIEVVDKEDLVVVASVIIKSTLEAIEFKLFLDVVIVVVIALVRKVVDNFVLALLSVADDDISLVNVGFTVVNIDDCFVALNDEVIK